MTFKGSLIASVVEQDMNDTMKKDREQERACHTRMQKQKQAGGVPTLLQ